MISFFFHSTVSTNYENLRHVHLGVDTQVLFVIFLRKSQQWPKRKSITVYLEGARWARILETTKNSQFIFLLWPIWLYNATGVNLSSCFIYFTIVTATRMLCHVVIRSGGHKRAFIRILVLKKNSAMQKVIKGETINGNTHNAVVFLFYFSLSIALLLLYFHRLLEIQIISFRSSHCAANLCERPTENQIRNIIEYNRIEANGVFICFFGGSSIN